VHYVSTCIRLLWYGDSVDNTQYLLFNLNVLVAVGKGMWAVKLYTNKILQFLTGGAN